MKIAAYCRVSTDKEDQLNSLQVQKNFFTEYAKKNGHDLIRLYADEGISGTRTKNRKEFLQMMRDAERGLFETIVVKDISRLARNTVDLLQSVRKLKALGVEMIFLTANMTSMGDSEFVLTVFGALAQEESRNISKRVKFSKHINAEKGRVPNLAYGYDKTIGDYFNLTINQEEAAVVRQIYHWYLEDGYGGSKIADLLNQRGLKTKRNCDWSQATVCRILTNPLYTGKIINGKQEVEDFLTGTRVDREQEDWLIVDKPELRIISDQDFQRSCQLMKNRNEQFRLNHKRQSNKYLFSTLIVCKHCGWSFRRTVRTYKNTYIRWVCSKHNGQGIHNCPNASTVDENELIEQLDQYFHSLLRDRGNMERCLREKLRSACRQEEGQDERRKAVEKRLARLEKQRSKLLDLYADDLITRQELDQKLSGSKEEISHLEEELERLRMDDLTEEEIQGIISRTMDRFNDFVSVRNLNNAQLKQLIEKIEVDEDGTVDVYLRLFEEGDRFPPVSTKTWPSDAVYS